jgi:hypothetical protein
MSEENIKVPRIALLGICDHARYDQGNPPYLSHLHILGLRKVVLGLIYPLDLSHLCLALAVFGVESSNLGMVLLRNQQGDEVFRIEIKISPDGELKAEGTVEDRASSPHMLIPVGKGPSWTTLAIPLKGVILNEPQDLDVFMKSDEEEIHLGVLSFGLATAPPLTADRIAAIKSDPRAIKALLFVLRCKVCDSTLRITASLEKPEKKEAGTVWYQDLPDEFTCACGKTKMSLRILKTNMHGLLGKTDISMNNLSISTLYQNDTIDRISEKFFQLVRSKPREEEVQRFLSSNPIIFHFLSPIRLFEKPPILSKHQADFAILDSRGTLVFIELERPDVLLLRKDGAASAEIEHAISQVRDWLYLYEKHRSAVLECLEIQEREVTRVKGLVIAGRDEGSDPDNLRKFKWQDRGAIDCQTYDDLLGNVAALSREMKAVQIVDNLGHPK